MKEIKSYIDLSPQKNQANIESIIEKGSISLMKQSSSQSTDRADER